MKKLKIAILLTFALIAALFITGCGGSNSTVNGTALSEFVIVYPEYGTGADLRAAEYVRDNILEITGVELEIADDSAKESDHEILIGYTNRDLSKSAHRTSRDSLQFVIMSDGASVALEGEFYMVAGAAYYFIDTYVTGSEFKAEIPESAVLSAKPTTPNNFVMLIGDGMGEYQTRLFDYLPFPYDNIQFEEYEENRFFGYDFPYHGYSKTDSYSGTTDSAAGGTALATGYKTINKYVGIDKDMNPVKSLTELANEKGMKTAVLSTDSVTGATPASFSAHASSRTEEAEIKESQKALDGKTTIICGLDGHTVSQIENTLIKTLTDLYSSENGMFIMYEEAHIDKRCHDNELENAFEKLVRFNRAINIFMEFALYNPDTMIVITADHETGALLPSATGVQFNRTSHSGADVPIFAYGEGCEYFDGQTMENTEIAKFFAKMMGEEHFGMQYEFDDPEGEGDEINSFD